MLGVCSPWHPGLVHALQQLLTSEVALALAWTNLLGTLRFVASVLPCIGPKQVVTGRVLCRGWHTRLAVDFPQIISPILPSVGLQEVHESARTQVFAWTGIHVDCVDGRVSSDLLFPARLVLLSS